MFCFLFMITRGVNKCFEAKEKTSLSQISIFIDNIPKEMGARMYVRMSVSSMKNHCIFSLVSYIINCMILCWLGRRHIGFCRPIPSIVSHYLILS